MTTKQKVDLDKYRKGPRLLGQAMEDALALGGGLHPVLVAVGNDARLRVDIRDHRFNVYYGGGNLMLVDGRTSPWALHFDEKYFRGGMLQPPILPTRYEDVKQACSWVDAFPVLIAGMEDWWTRHPKVERTHCQAIAAANSAAAGLHAIDYLILDLEYQWAQRRFDMIAAKRRTTKEDAIGWAQPDFVFVEVKSEYGACCGKSGLGDHVRDYRDIVSACGGRSVDDIKHEYENMIAQKTRLRLFDSTMGFEHFSTATPEMLIVLVNLAVGTPALRPSLEEVRVVSDELGDHGHVRYIQLGTSEYRLNISAEVAPQQLVGGLS